MSRTLLVAAAVCVALRAGVVTIVDERPAAAAQTACIPPDVLRRVAARAKDVIVLHQICENGEQKDDSSVFLDAPDWPKHPDPAAIVTRDKTQFAKGITIFRAPPTTAFDFVAPRSVTHLFPGAGIEKYALAQSEFTRLTNGKADFWVTAATAVSNIARTAASKLGSPTVGVLAESVYAVSRDTVFSVEVVPKKSVTLVVTEGTVDVTLATSIRLVAEGVIIDGIRDADVLSAGQTMAYAVPSPPHDFPNADAARAFYLTELQAALESDDRPRIEDWTFDLHQLDQAVPAAAHLPRRTAVRVALPYVAGALVIALPMLLRHKTTTTNAPTVPGTATLQGFHVRPLPKP